MRLLAAFVLVLQFQPLVGSAVCIYDAGHARAECTMPHHEQPAGGSLMAASTAAPGSCAGMSYCAPTAPAVLELAEHFRISSSSHRAPALNRSFLAPGDPLAPPFHPPKA